MGRSVFFLCPLPCSRRVARLDRGIDSGFLLLSDSDQMLDSHYCPESEPFDWIAIFYTIILRCRRSFNVSAGLDEASCPLTQAWYYAMHRYTLDVIRRARGGTECWIHIFVSKLGHLIGSRFYCNITTITTSAITTATTTTTTTTLLLLPPPVLQQALVVPLLGWNTCTHNINALRIRTRYKHDRGGRSLN